MLITALKDEMNDKDLINWSVFKGSDGGFVFEEICYHLLKVIGGDLLYEWDLTRGADGGRDILVFRVNPKESAIKHPVCVVECKSRVGRDKNILKMDEVSKIFPFALSHNINRILILTNAGYHADVVNTIIRINQINAGMLVLPINKSELESLLQNEKHLFEMKGGKIFPADYLNGNVIEFRPNVKELVHNFIGGVESAALLGMNNSSENFKYSEPSEPVDTIYSDPENNISKISKAINKYKVVSVLGSAGVGKTRLIKEAAADCQNSSFLDLSINDYLSDLKTQLLTKIFDISYESLISLPTEYLQKIISDKLEPPDLSNDLVKLIESESDIPEESAADIIVNCISSLFPDSFWFIDNIHRLSNFDNLLIKSMYEHESIKCVVVSARHNEISEQLSSLITPWMNNSQTTIFEIDQVSSKEYVSNFLKIACEEKAYSKLKYLSSVENMHELMLNLKDLNCKGIINVDKAGKLSLFDSHFKKRVGGVSRTIDSIIQSLAHKDEIFRYKEILWMAATFGRSFPVKYLEESISDYTPSIVDKLLSSEIMKLDYSEYESGIWLKFDHEITHNCIYESIPIATRIANHQSAIKYIESHYRYREGIDDGKLMFHYGALGYVEESVRCSMKYSHYLRLRGHLPDALEVLENGFAELQKTNSNESLLLIECHLICSVLKVMEELGDGNQLLSNDLYKRRVSALQLCITMLMGNAPREAILKLKTCSVKVACLNAKSIEEVESTIENAIIELKLSDSFDELIELRRFLSVQLKRAGQFSKSAHQLKFILRILRNNNCRDAREHRAFAYLNAGSLSLESQKYSSVISWWNNAVEVLSGTTQIGKLSHALIDRAYAYALFYPEAAVTGDYLENALHFSRRYGLKYDSCRSLINYANWMFFKGLDMKLVKDYILQAEKIAVRLDDSYLVFLVSFTKLNMTKKLLVFDVDKCINNLVSSLRDLPDFLLHGAGDIRVLNFLMWVKNSENEIQERIFRELPNLKGVKWKVNMDNKYYMGDGLYATFF